MNNVKYFAETPDANFYLYCQRNLENDAFESACGWLGGECSDW